MIAISTPIRILPRRDIRMLGISGRMATNVLLTSCRSAVDRPAPRPGRRAAPCYSNVPTRGPVPGQWHDLAMTDHAGSPGPPPILLEALAAEIEAFAGRTGWDQAPSLYALVPTRALAADPAA